MRSIIYLVPVLTILLLTNCRDDASGDLQITFRLEYSDEPLVIFEEYTYPEGPQMQFNRVSFFISDVALMDEGTTHQLLDVDMVNMTNDHLDLTGATQGTKLLLESVEPGRYDGFQFNIGLPASLNAMQPADFASDHPLANSGEYWTGWQSYVFTKVEGNLDFDNDGEFEQTMALHLGSDAVLRTKVMPGEIEILTDKTTNLEIVIDLEQFFRNGDAIYDIVATPHIHKLSQLDQAIELADNLIGAMSSEQ